MALRGRSLEFRRSPRPICLKKEVHEPADPVEIGAIFLPGQRPGSIDQAGRLLAQASEDAALGDQHHVGTDSEISGDLGGSLAKKELASERIPGHRGELGLDNFQQSPGHEPVVFLVPYLRLRAGWILEAVELGIVGLSGGGPPRTPESRSRCTLIVRSQLRNRRAARSAGTRAARGQPP